MIDEPGCCAGLEKQFVDHITNPLRGHSPSSQDTNGWLCFSSPSAKSAPAALAPHAFLKASVSLLLFSTWLRNRFPNAINTCINWVITVIVSACSGLENQQGFCGPQSSTSGLCSAPTSLHWPEQRRETRNSCSFFPPSLKTLFYLSRRSFTALKIFNSFF